MRRFEQTMVRPGPVYMDKATLTKLSESLGCEVKESGVEQIGPGTIATGTFEVWITFVLEGEEITATARTVGVQKNQAYRQLLKKIADRVTVLELQRDKRRPGETAAIDIDILFFGPLADQEL